MVGADRMGELRMMTIITCNACETRPHPKEPRIFLGHSRLFPFKYSYQNFKRYRQGEVLLPVVEIIEFVLM